jgi:sortase A
MGLTGLAIATALGALGFIIFPFYTDWHASQQQRELRASFASKELKDAYRNGKLGEGSAVTRIRIPAIGTDSIVVQGISLKALNTGAGHYPDTPLPGQAGNVAIAGHRTTYGKPFAHEDQLKQGDKIYLTTPFARYTYEVLPSFGGHSNPWVVANNDWSVANPTPDSELTLTTCHPPGKATNRLVTRAKLIKTEPLA